MFEKIRFPFHQIRLVPLLKEKLDQVFFDVIPTTRNVILHKDVLVSQKVELNNLKEVYSLEADKILRFDHTHVTKYYDLNPYYNELNYGPVFRKEPSKKGRYREFFQYDVDYRYETHGYRPLLVLMRYLGPNFSVRVNDLSIDNSLKSNEKKPP